MTNTVATPKGKRSVTTGNSLSQAVLIPSTIRAAGETASRRFLEFFTAHIRNKGTRAAYGHAVGQFCAWCESHAIRLNDIEPIVVAAYIESLTARLSAPTVKLHLAAIRMLFNYLVTGQIVSFNPAASVRGPKHVVKKGKTPVLTAAEARQLLDSIDTKTIIGLRDRALIAVMAYSFARVSAAVGMNVEDYFPQGRRMWFRLHEKGGKLHDVPAHHNAEKYLDEYLESACVDNTKINSSPKSPLFRTISRKGALTANRMHRIDALRMVKRRAVAAGLTTRVCNHTFRATGITTYLENEGMLEHAQEIAAHESVRSTKLYDRRSDAISLDEIERIII